MFRSSVAAPPAVTHCKAVKGLIALGGTQPFPRTGQWVRIESFLKTFFNAKTGQGLYASLWLGFESARETERVPSYAKAVSLWPFNTSGLGGIVCRIDLFFICRKTAVNYMRITVMLERDFLF